MSHFSFTEIIKHGDSATLYAHVNAHDYAAARTLLT